MSMHKLLRFNAHCIRHHNSLAWKRGCAGQNLSCRPSSTVGEPDHKLLLPNWVSSLSFSSLYFGSRRHLPCYLHEVKLESRSCWQASIKSLTPHKGAILSRVPAVSSIEIFPSASHFPSENPSASSPPLPPSLARTANLKTSQLTKKTKYERWH